MIQKFYWVIICIFFFPVIAEGEEWVRVTEIHNFYVDVNSIIQVEHVQFQAWSKTEFENSASLKEVRIHSLYHCAERKVKELQGTLYYQDGSVHEEGMRDWHSVVPESNYEKVLNFVCTFKRGVLNIPKR